MSEDKSQPETETDVRDGTAPTTALNDQSGELQADDLHAGDSHPSNQQTGDSQAERQDAHSPDADANADASTIPTTTPVGIDEPTGSSSASESPNAKPAGGAGGPINLERIRELRKSQQRTFAPVRKPPRPGGEKTSSSSETAKPKAVHSPLSKNRGVEEGVIKAPEPQAVAPKVAVPSPRARLSADLEDELAAALGETGNLDSLLVGDSMLQVGVGLTEGQRIQGKIMKARGEHVFVSLGGPNEGVIAATQFEELPAEGTQIEVVVRGFLADEGLYELTIPGMAVEVNDWDDLNEGEVIEVLVTGANSGGLECKAGSVSGFIPASQVAEYRVENLADMVDQKVLCVITEANPRRGNLVLSRRAVLEREKREKREERLAALQIGDAVEGTVTKILDFGAFVDIGGLDGLLHISQLSWERVEHPSEILEQGQKIQVRIDKIDEQTGKIGLSYRSLQEHPWTGINERFPVGSIAKGSVTRIAEFGAFVRIATGVEGLVHLSELAHHRVHRVSNVVQEGQEIEVKVLSIDEENQRMSLSLKAAQAAPLQEQADENESAAEEAPAKPVLAKHTGPLKGGTSRKTGGEDIGLKW